MIARRLTAVPGALAGYRASLAEGARRGLHAAPRQVQTVTSQSGRLAGSRRRDPAGSRLRRGRRRARRAPRRPGPRDRGRRRRRAGLSDWLRPATCPGSRHARRGGTGPVPHCARRWLGARLDLAEAYEWGWAQYREILAQLQDEARHVLPGASPQEAMRYLDEHAVAVEGVEQVRRRLQQMMDEAIADLDGTHFELADPIKIVEAMIAPPGSAAAPYYTGPSQDFSRPGRTWLPTLGKTPFPVWNLISTWYHEGVPGHHLQLAQWTYLTGQLSTFQTVVGGVSACLEGWALYAERLMDELGYLRPAGARMGYLDAQLMRAIRVIIDIGMHLGLTVPADSPVGAGQIGRRSWRSTSSTRTSAGRRFLASEIVRYLGLPGQAISYKLGERAWLAGRDAARPARGAGFDLKSWHMAALSLGSLGLDDLADELARL